MFFDFFTPKPFDTGYLPDENGHRVFYQQFGNRAGEPVLCFHGGPGSFSKAKQTGAFDLRKHRVILFDQRGCGQSTPAGAITHNTTDDLIGDARRLLDLLQVDQAHVYGASWGSTLALLFAQRYPHHVKKLVIGKTFLARLQDIDWIASQSRIFYPDIYERMERHVPAGKSLRAHYADLMLSDNAADQIASANLYGRYEYMVGSLEPAFTAELPTPAHLQSYRMYMHYDRMDYGVGDNRILDNMHTIAHIPLLILHNRLDMICPVEQSWLVHKAHPMSKLVIVPDHGHGSDRLNRVEKREIAAFL